MDQTRGGRSQRDSEGHKCVDMVSFRFLKMSKELEVESPVMFNDPAKSRGLSLSRLQRCPDTRIEENG